MKRVTFIVPVHGREALTKVCLRQLSRTCDAIEEYDLAATAFVIGEGPILDYAESLGFGTVARDNKFLGRRFNDGYDVACNPKHNPEPADYVVPCGSDDWLDPAIFQRLPTNAIGIFRKLAIVSEDRKHISRLHVGFKGGVGIRIIPRKFIQAAGYRPAEEDRKRACDTSTLYGMFAAAGKRMPPMVDLDVHPFQIVDWKTSGEQLNSYAMLRGYRRGAETADPFKTLAGIYPKEALEEMRSLV